MKVCLFLCLAFVPCLLADIWKDCSKSSDPVKINYLKISPDPPKIGQSVSIAGNITTSEDITGGSIEIKAKYGIIPLIDQTQKICDVLPQANLKCPLKAGSYALNETTTIPSEAPKGHYTGSVIGTDQNGKELFCIEIDGHLS